MNHPDQMRFRKGGRALMLFGLAFFLMSLFFMVMGLRGEMKTENGDVASPLLVILFSIPFLSIGLALILGRAGVDIDRRSGSLTSWWGLLFLPLRSNRHDLAKFTHVSLSRKVVRTKNSTRTLFPVTLAAGDLQVECEARGDYTLARSRAESLARFLGLDLHDDAEGDTVIRKAEHLDETVAQRARRLGLEPLWPGLPASSRILCDHDGETAVIRLPPPGFPWGHALMLIPALAFILFVVILFLIPFVADEEVREMPVAGYVVFAGFFGLFVFVPLGAAILPVLRGIVRELTLAASGQGIHIESRGPFSRKRWTFPADQLEELSLVRPGLRERPSTDGDPRIPNETQVPETPGKLVIALAKRAGSASAPGLRLRSDRDLCVIGDHLTDDELLWLHDAIHYILVSAPHA